MLRSKPRIVSLTLICMWGVIPAFRSKRAAQSPGMTKGHDILELHGAAKVPHRNREQLSRMLGRPLSSIHLFEGHVGGGFGVRGELYPEDVLVCVAAMRLGRPIKWIEDRREHLIATNHSREQRHKIRAAVDAEGHILAIDDVFSTIRAPMSGRMAHVYWRWCPACFRGRIAFQPIASPDTTA